MIHMQIIINLRLSQVDGVWIRQSINILGRWKGMLLNYLWILVMLLVCLVLKLNLV